MKKAIREMKQWMRTMLPSAIMVLTAGWFAACSQDDDISDTPPTEQKQIPITFAGAEGEAQSAPTRATTSPFSAKRRSFVFSGYKHYDAAPYESFAQRQKVFDAYAMKYDESHEATDNARGWYYVGIANENSILQTIKYWDYSATAYRFFAISGPPLNKEEGNGYRRLIVGLDGANEDDHTVGEDEKITPYLTQTLIVPRERFGQPVTLTFYKPFARVRFILVDESGNTITKKSPLSRYITTIRFRPTDADRNILHGGICVSTHYTLGDSPEALLELQIDGQKNHTALTIPYEPEPAAGDDYAFVTDADKERWWHVLGNRTTRQGSYTLSFLYNGTLRSATVPADYMQWRIGYAYTYVFKVSEEGEPTFDVGLSTYTKWQSGYTQTTTW